jgi:epoxyqueuosine reductase QueG
MNENVYQYLKELSLSSELNHLPEQYGGDRIFDPPLMGVSRGDDPIFGKYKEVIGPEHLTPVEMWTANGLETVQDSARRLRILSIVFPYVKRIRDESKTAEIMPAEIYCVGRNYANAFISDVQRKTVQFFENQGYRALAPILSPVFQILVQRTAPQFYSLWSERHMAFAAGLGTFSLHEGLITEAGCNIRLGSVLTDAPLAASTRKSDEPYANCLYHARGKCRECEKRCPADAITESGHDKMKCRRYGEIISKEMNERLGSLLKPHQRNVADIGIVTSYPVGCAFCQFSVPCMDRNPVKRTSS